MRARLVGCSVIVCLSACRATPKGADLILTNAHVYTLRWDDPAPDGTPARNAPFDRVTGWRPDAEAIAIQAGRILYVGTDDSALTYSGASTRLIDMRGRTIVPGLVDAQTAALAAGTSSQLRRALDTIAAAGYTLVHDAGADRREMHALEQLARADSLPIRVYPSLSGRDTGVLHTWYDRGLDSTNAGTLIVRSIALVTDSSRTPYDTLSLNDMMIHGWQLIVEAVDSTATRRSLDFIQREMATNSIAAHTRPRIEGVQFVSASDIPRFTSSGTIVSTQPARVVEELMRLDRQSGRDRNRDAYPWRSLRVAGARLVFGSDFSRSGADIFTGLYAAMTRRVPNGSSANSPQDAQVMTAEEALRGFTSWAAYAGYDEWESGRIAPGMRADLTVMTIDPLAETWATADHLLQGKIAMTIVGGRVIYEH